uniref:Uncharacterized protein n=1 Tax=Rhizophora mucronata TaxID=61149 RepID=A0A2P2PMK4_RHIMU
MASTNFTPLPSPKFFEENYMQWSVIMKTYLIAFLPSTYHIPQEFQMESIKYLPPLLHLKDIKHLSHPSTCLCQKSNKE